MTHCITLIATILFRVFPAKEELNGPYSSDHSLAKPHNLATEEIGNLQDLNCELMPCSNFLEHTQGPSQRGFKPCPSASKLPSHSPSTVRHRHDTGISDAGTNCKWSQPDVAMMFKKITTWCTATLKHMAMAFLHYVTVIQPSALNLPLVSCGTRRGSASIHFHDSDALQLRLGSCLLNLMRTLVG